MFGSVLWEPDLCEILGSQIFLGFRKKKVFEPLLCPLGDLLYGSGYGRRGVINGLIMVVWGMKYGVASTIMPQKQQGKGYILY